eukprot:TRINITY_DN3050_c0_g1_i1.p1 TRINITY_DN3050_c0_g1~~TRINITY_DN3050_c0_g1_i1.p1  ORF type:complete len:121 (-),score=22.77 TRINITY_DN3050_c0_g1_i1:96-458(-)
MLRSYIRNSFGIFIMFDVTNPESFERVRSVWNPKIDEYGSGRVVKLLVANKCDAGTDERKVSPREGQAMADEIGARYFEVSSRTGDGVAELFATSAPLIQAVHNHQPTPRPPANSQCFII